LVVLCGQAQQQEGDVISAVAFVLKDPQGNPVGALSAKRGYPLLFFTDSEGQNAVSLVVNEDKPVLFLGKPGKHRMSLGVVDEKAGLVVRDDDGKPRVIIGIDPDSTGIGILDTHGKMQAQLASSNKGVHLSLYENGAPRIRSTVSKDGPQLEILDPDGQRVFMEPKQGSDLDLDRVTEGQH
jgi:hypothetical protein